MACLADDDWLVRELAVEALQAANAVEAVPQLESLAFLENDETVRAAIAEALGSLGSSTSVEAITALFQRGDDAVRGFAVGALGQLAPSSGNEELLRHWLAAERSPHVRAKALANLAWRGPDDAKRFRRFVEVADGEVAADVAASELGFVLASASPPPGVLEDIEVALRALCGESPGGPRISGSSAPVRTQSMIAVRASCHLVREAEPVRVHRDALHAPRRGRSAALPLC